MITAHNATDGSYGPKTFERPLAHYALRCTLILPCAVTDPTAVIHTPPFTFPVSPLPVRFPAYPYRYLRLEHPILQHRCLIVPYAYSCVDACDAAATVNALLFPRRFTLPHGFVNRLRNLLPARVLPTCHGRFGSADQFYRFYLPGVVPRPTLPAYLPSAVLTGFTTTGHYDAAPTHCAAVGSYATIKILHNTSCGRRVGGSNTHVPQHTPVRIPVGRTPFLLTLLRQHALPAACHVLPSRPYYITSN